MSGNALVLVKLVLIVGAVLAFGAWQLWQLRRDKRRPPPPEERDDRD